MGKGKADPPKGKTGRDAVLGADEVDLWQRAVRDAIPIVRKAIAPLPTPQPLGPRAPAPAPKHEPAPPPVRRSHLPRATPVGPAELAPGSTKDIDARTAERLRRGELPIDATLDLHGHTAVEAHRALAGFIDRAWRGHLRCLLVITGKGRAPEAELGPGAQVGVIKAGVPRWLNEPGLRGRILAIAQARPQHGGGGALYVLLKRQR